MSGPTDIQGTSLSLILSELKQLKKEGVDSLWISEASLASLAQPSSMAPFKRENEAADRTLKDPTSQRKPSSSKPKPAIDLMPPLMNQENASLFTSTAKPLAADPISPPPQIQLPQGSKKEQWEYLKSLVLSCPECKRQVKPGKQIVFGVGNLEADIFFCGEAPGADEEIEGVPFVGRAGQLLTKMIQGMGLSRDQVYIGNIMNFRPDTGTPFGNRPPSQKEMEFCLPYLKAQLAIVKPKVIVALGATAVNGLLGVNPKRKMGEIRGQWQNFEGIPLMVTFHPSYLLRNNTNRTKRQVWEDLLAVMEAVGLPIHEKQRNYFL